jgi:hypothetical protein
MMKTPIPVAAVMPPMTATPTAWRAPAPAPVVIARGMRPKIKETAVIITARKRCSAPVRAASAMDCPSSRSSRANPTIRIAFFAATPIRSTMAICA